MKSIYAGFRRSRIAISTILEALNLDFKGISHLKMLKIAKNSKFRAAEMVKMAVFGDLQYDQN